MKIEIKITKDNSHTLFIPELNETYHSKHGAVQEANHVFIDAGLKYFSAKQLSVLEVGFGTGLNTLLTYRYAENYKTDINYYSVELYPLKKELIAQLNYTSVIKGVSQELFLSIHNSSWEEANKISTYFKLTKINKSILEDINLFGMDLVYFDAFGPEVQPEMWSKEVFEQIYTMMKPNGVLVTYCAKGVVKRTLKEVGFMVENLPGPPGKREMTRAIKC
jgi:tRNA U34 5-methylaminomethyl-2-thiouridine-forming methyltransferase MnmC